MNRKLLITLKNKSKMKKEKIKLDALKLIAESYGFELVEKKRDPKVGDFGKFWDDNDNEEEYYCFGFITEITSFGFKDCFHSSSWSNFSHLTDEEKKQIQENW